MKKVILLVSGLLILIQFNCTKEVISPIENEYPDKLYPYETFYDAATFKQRRDNLINKIPDDAIAVIVTNDIYLRNGDVDYDFRPASTFYYLTGFEEPNSIAVIRNKANKSELIMFVEEREGIAVQWMGPVYGPDGAVEYFGADSAYTFQSFPSLIKSYLNSGVYQSVYANFESNQTVADLFYNSVNDSIVVNNIDEIVNELRSIKSPIEIEAIQKAVDVAVQGFKEAMRTIEPGIYEYEVEAIFEYILRLNGCPRDAFPTIVASGPNINVLHYDANQRETQNNDLVMIDFGAEYGYYTSDVTRTLPVNGKYSSRQATIYNIVKEAYLAAINGAAPGVSYYDLYYLNRDIILDRLLEKGIIYGEKSTMISSGSYRQYIPGGLGHCVGLDVHDPFPREQDGNRILRENMVLAFEPHIYLYEGDQTVNQDYWNISARIEDVILITASGSEILSKNLPFDIEKIEELMK